MIRRGQIWWANLEEPVGSEPGYRRPVLVIQRNEVNASRIKTVVVCVLTGNTALARAPGNVLLPKRRTGLSRDSVANASQVMTLDKEQLVAQVGRVTGTLLQNVEDGLRWMLQLDARTASLDPTDT